MSKVFVSYKRVDKDKVFSIVRQLESELGIQFWIDLDGIESDEQFASAILKAINQCEVLLFMYSKAHHKITDFERDWTVREINYADEKRKRIVFIDIESVNLPDWFILKFPLKQVIQAEDTQAMERLKKDMCKWLKIPWSIGSTHHTTVDSHNVFPKIAIDLGLPSGTRWASYNVGAEKPEEYGGYFSWGETEEKEDYYCDSYTHCDGEEFTNHDLGEIISGTKYDVAHIKWGGEWQMPTRNDFEELIDNCSHKWTKLNGINGCLFTGPNGKSIFFPAASSFIFLSVKKLGAYCDYWSGSEDLSFKGYGATSLYIDDEECHLIITWDREEGKSIRPIIRIH